MSGYVRIHRSLIGHPAFRNDAEGLAFAWMIARAAWKPVRVRYKGRAIVLERGQLSISQRDMALALDRDKAWIERLWKRLRAEAMINVASEAGVAVITICNYARYQANEDAREAVAEAPRKADARQTQGTEQGREEGKKEVDANASTARARKADPFPMPDGTDPEHWRDFLANRKRKSLPNTPSAHKRLLADIAKFTDDEWPPGRLIELAAGKGWASVNDPRQEYRNGHQPNSGSRNTLRGDRPSPALDLYLSAARAEAEGLDEDTAFDRGAWPALSSFGPS